MKAAVIFEGRLRDNASLHSKRNLLLTYNGENVIRLITPLILIGGLSNLHVTRAGIESKLTVTLRHVTMLLLAIA